MRAVLFDTETTGIDPKEGHRIIEIAALELFRDLPTGNHFYALIDPERDIPSDASRIHGYTNAHVAGQPGFADIADDFLAFVADDPLIAHNAPFDFAHLDAELARIGRRALDRTKMICTLVLAKARFPGMPNSLDALCRRYEIDLSARTTHNALLDCRLLADVYVELTGGRQRGFDLAERRSAAPVAYAADTSGRTPRLVVPDAAHLAAHAAFVGRLKDPLWTRSLCP